MKKEIINASTAPEALGPYNHAIKAGDTLYISGQLGINGETGVLLPNIMGQAHQAIVNLGHVLETAGLTYDNVVKTTIFLADLNDFNLVNETYAFYFKKDFPARSCVQAAALPKGALIEIEAIAVYTE